MSAGMPTHRLCVEVFRFVGGEDERHLLAESIGLIDPAGGQLTRPAGLVTRGMGYCGGSKTTDVAVRSNASARMIWLVHRPRSVKDFGRRGLGDGRRNAGGKFVVEWSHPLDSLVRYHAGHRLLAKTSRQLVRCTRSSRSSA